MTCRPELADPILAGPMSEQGLLVCESFEPYTFVDHQMTEERSPTVMVDLITDGAFDDLETDTGTTRNFRRVECGWDADARVGADARRRATGTRSCSSSTNRGRKSPVPLHPAVRTTILVILAQLARSAGRRQGLSLHPVTADPSRVADLMRTLSRSPMPSAGHLVSLDIEPAAINLGEFPSTRFSTFANNTRISTRRICVIAGDF